MLVFLFLFRVVSITDDDKLDVLIDEIDELSRYISTLKQLIIENMYSKHKENHHNVAQRWSKKRLGNNDDYFVDKYRYLPTYIPRGMVVPSKPNRMEIERKFPFLYFGPGSKDRNGTETGAIPRIRIFNNTK